MGGRNPGHRWDSRKPRPTHRPGLSVCSGEMGVVHHHRAADYRHRRLAGSALLGQRDRVEHTPRGDRTRPVDALRPDDARYVGVLDE